MRFIRKSALISAVVLTAMMGMGAGAANAADGDSTSSGSIVYVGEGTAAESDPREVIDPTELITVENSRKLGVDEVRSVYSVKDMVVHGKSLGEIKKYYPTTTAGEVKALKREVAESPQLRITNPICNNVDFYSIVRDFDQKEYCFANAGTMDFYMPNIYKVCPGNNTGFVYYTPASGGYYQSTVRGPVVPRTHCYFFGMNVTVTGVTIY